MRVARSVRLLLVPVVLVLAGPGTAAAVGAPAGGAPAGSPRSTSAARRGSALSVPPAQLAASLSCNGSLDGLPRDPILVVPGSTRDPQVNFSWNYERAFDRLGGRWCAVRLPYDATGDIQVAGEYVVNALRTMSAEAHRTVDVVGWSQGCMVAGLHGRWSVAGHCGSGRHPLDGR